MCCEPDYNYSTIDSRIVKARKRHECVACDDGIENNDRYVRTVCLSSRDAADGGALESYKHCLRCWSVLRAVRTERPDDAIAWALDCGEDWNDTIGAVPDDLAALAFMTREQVQMLDVDVATGSYTGAR